MIFIKVYIAGVLCMKTKTKTYKLNIALLGCFIKKVPCLILCFLTFKGTVKLNFRIFSMDINSRAFCETPSQQDVEFQPRNDRIFKKRVTTSLLKMWPNFSKL